MNEFSVLGERENFYSESMWWFVLSTQGERQCVESVSLSANRLRNNRRFVLYDL